MPLYRYKVGDIFEFSYIRGWHVVGRIFSISNKPYAISFIYKILWKSEHDSKMEGKVGTFSAFSLESKMYRQSKVIDEKTAMLEVL